MTIRTSENASVLGRYSTSYFGYIVEMLVLSIGFGIFSVPTIRAKIFRQYDNEIDNKKINSLIIASILSMPMIILIASFTDAISYFRISLLLFIPILIVTVTLYRLNKLFSYSTLIRWPTLSLLFLILQIILITYFFGTIPQLNHVDEIWETGKAYYIFQNSGIPIDLKPERRIDSWLFFPFISWITGGYLTLLRIGVLEARAFYLLVGAGSLPFIYLTSKRLYGPLAGWSAALLVLFIIPHYNWARPDFWVPTATSIATFLFFSARDNGARNNFLYSFACGFFILSTIEGHFYGIFFAIMFSIVHVIEQLNLFRKSEWNILSEFKGFVCGCLLFTLFWFWYHIYLPGINLTDIPKLFILTYSWEITVAGPGINDAGFLRILGNLFVQFRLFYANNINELFLCFVVLATAFYRQKGSDRILLFIFVGSAILTTLFMAHAQNLYLIFWMPIIAIFFGAFIQDIGSFQEKGGFSQNTNLSNVVIIVFSFVFFAYISEAVADSSKENNLRRWKDLEILVEASRRINEVLPREDIVVSGYFTIYLGMSDRLNYHARFWREPIGLTYLLREEPKALILIPGEHERWDELIIYFRENSFELVECIPIPEMDNYFGKDIGHDRTLHLYLHPDYLPDESSENCNAEDFSKLL